MELYCAHFFLFIISLIFYFMDPNTDTSYQDDILKVKQIWNDLQDVEKSSHKKPQSSKAHKKTQTNNKIQNGAKSTKTKQQPHYSKSQIILNQPKIHKPQTIITFSTQKPQPPIQQTNQTAPLDSSPTVHSKYIDNFNYRSAIQQKDAELSILRVSNQRLKDRVDRLQKNLEEKDELIAKYKRREDELLGATSKFSSEKIEAITRNVQYANYKSDSKRLLKMLQATEEYKYFAKMAIDDDGVRRLTMAGKKSKIDATEGGKEKTDKRLHFCSCNQDFIPEDNFWVPEKVYDFGKDYAKQHKGESLSEAELQLLIYELNKIWRQREKRIINWLKSQNVHEVGKYKRKVQDMRKQALLKSE